MKKLLAVLFVLALAALAGPVAAGSPPVTVTYVRGMMAQTITSESFTLNPDGKTFYPFECPSYATSCVLLFGNSSDGTEVVWLTSEARFTADASPIEIDAAMTATAVISPGAFVWFSTHTESWSQEYPSHYRVDLVAKTTNVVVGEAANTTTPAPSSVVGRAVPYRAQ